MIQQSKTPAKQIAQDAESWLKEQLNRHFSLSLISVENQSLVLKSILAMGQDFEDVFSSQPFSSLNGSATLNYFSSFVNELLGNIFVTQSCSIEEGLRKLELARSAARIYLDGKLDPGTFLGYPILKILVCNSVQNSQLIISCLEKGAEKIRQIPPNKLELLIDLATTTDDLCTLIESYTPTPPLDFEELLTHLPRSETA